MGSLELRGSSNFKSNKIIIYPVLCLGQLIVAKVFVGNVVPVKNENK